MKSSFAARTANFDELALSFGHTQMLAQAANAGLHRLFHRDLAWSLI
jgi:hypothetical protein